MADTTKQLQDIEALLAERRKYEQWIAQLESRKATTPEHVYRKVRTDYDARLGEAQARLAAETDAVQALVSNLESARAAQDEKLGAKSDERSEAELRASVGEFGEKEWDKLRAKLDGAIADMTRERDATQKELDNLRALLAEAAASAASEGALAAPPTPTPEAAVAEAQPRAAAVAATAPLAAIPTEPGVSAAPAPAVPPSVPPAVQVAAPLTSIEAAPRSTGATRAKDTEDAPAAPRPDFDELAFLKSVVGRTTPPTSPSGMSTVAEPGARSSSASAKRSSSSLQPSTPDLMATPDVPLEPSDDVKRESGAFQASNLSTFGGRTPRSSEAIKSLKCGECGTLNYPTEWYCERCGGELAAF